MHEVRRRAWARGRPQAGAPHAPRRRTRGARGGGPVSGARRPRAGRYRLSADHAPAKFAGPRILRTRVVAALCCPLEVPRLNFSSTRAARVRATQPRRVHPRETLSEHPRAMRSHCAAYPHACTEPHPNNFRQACV